MTDSLETEFQTPAVHTRDRSEYTGGEDEASMLMAAKAGDQKAIAWIYRTFERLVDKYARAISSKYPQFTEDVALRGIEEFCSCVNKYDPSRDFVPYALTVAKRAMVDEAVRLAGGAFPEKDTRENFDRIGAYLRDCELKEELPTRDEIATKLGLLKCTVDRYYRTKESGPTGVMEIRVIPFEELRAKYYGFLDQSNDDVENLKARLQSLPETERRILIENFGLNGGGALDCKQIAIKLGMHPHSVNKIKHRGLRMLRDILEEA